ncbi:MFS transporter [Spirosoma linguale]|uniref:Major facilitator superfamily MFS_1 n=1 Tax=Spirosoma linguale (strain ATCC 33905 / DSM 74 / LMG 10896 / Claus 1) TaxID=504472 RepID=D2QNJ2_SPILD|nr:major facilitator superfamily MFS_1 [Spirosoma linguale DSM 74]
MANRQLLHIYAIIFIDVIVGSAVGPILPEFVKGLERPQLWLAVGTALFLGMQLFSAPLLGKLSDGYGRRPIFIISAIGTFLADCLLLPVRVGYYFANRVSDGTTNGMYATVRSAITDISPKESLFKNLGIEGAIISLGFVIGPAVSGLLLTTFDVVQGDQARVVAIMAVTLSSVNMILSWTLRETHPNPPGITTAALKMELANSLDVHTLWTRLLAKDRQYPGLKILVMMQLALTLSTGYYFYFVTFASFGALQMDAKAISYFFMYFGGLSVVISYVFYGYIADRINQRLGIFWFALLGAPILGSYGLVGTSVLWLYILVTVDCLTFSLIQGLIEGLMAQLTSDEDRGEIFGINQALQGVASFVTTVIFGALSLIDLRLPFAWFGTCLAVVAWLAWQRKR